LLGRKPPSQTNPPKTPLPLFAGSFFAGAFWKRFGPNVMHQVQPRSRNNTSNTGIGMPINHNNIQPILPSLRAPP